MADMTIQQNNARMTVIGKSWSNLPPTSGPGDWDNTYDGTYSGEIPRTDMPTKIAVTTPPLKTRYYENERLDLRGLVVTAYNSDNSIWTNQDYPLGEIYPPEIFPSTDIASNLEDTSKGYITVDGVGDILISEPYTYGCVMYKLNNGAIPPQWSRKVDGFSTYAFSWSNDGVLIEQKSSGDSYRSPDNMMVGRRILFAADWGDTIYRANNGTGERIASSSPPPFPVEPSYWADVTSGFFGNEYTYNGKKVKWQIYGQEGTNYFGVEGTPGITSPMTPEGQAWIKRAAWEMVFGERHKIKAVVLGWIRPDGIILTTNLELSVN